MTFHLFCAAGPPLGGSTEINGPKLNGPKLVGWHSAEDPAGVAQSTLHY